MRTTFLGRSAAATLLLLSLGTACSKESTPQGTETTPTSTGAEIALAAAFEGDGFSIQPPEGWTVDDSGSQGAAVIFTADPVDGFQSNINVRRDEVPGQTLDEVVEQSRTDLAEAFPGYEIFVDEATTVSGLPAHTFEATLTSDDVEYHNLQIFVLVGESVFTVTATGTEAQWDHDDATFRASMATFQVDASRSAGGGSG